VFAATAPVLNGCIEDVPSEANAPWRNPGDGVTDVRRKALSFGILAPNPHNRQPWLVDLRRENEVTLYLDQSRLLPETDPYSRQILIGLGCFVENTIIAASAFGRRVLVEPFPGGVWHEKMTDERPVAKLIFEQTNIEVDELFPQITVRRSVKEPYEIKRPVEKEKLSQLAAAFPRSSGKLYFTNDEKKGSELRSLLYQGLEREMLTPAKLKESIDLMRIGSKEIKANPDGIDLGGSMFAFLKFFGLLKRKHMMDTSSKSFKSTLDNFHEMCNATPAFIWQTTGGNSRLDQLVAGRGYMRLTLQATKLGLSLHPMSQLLQEYKEIKDLQGEFLNLVNATSDERVQMLCRVGYGPKTTASPRWPLKNRIVV